MEKEKENSGDFDLKIGNKKGEKEPNSDQKALADQGNAVAKQENALAEQKHELEELKTERERAQSLHPSSSWWVCLGFGIWMFIWFGGFLLVDLCFFPDMKTWSAPVGIVVLQFFWVLYLFWLGKSDAFVILLERVFNVVKREKP